MLFVAANALPKPLPALAVAIAVPAAKYHRAKRNDPKEDGVHSDDKRVFHCKKSRSES